MQRTLSHHVFSSLKLSLDLYYTEDEIYELSYTREPKNCKAHVSYKSRGLSAPTMQYWGQCSFSMLINVCLKR